MAKKDFSSLVKGVINGTSATESPIVVKEDEKKSVETKIEGEVIENEISVTKKEIQAQNWARFESISIEHSKSADKGASVWVDNDIIGLLNELKGSGASPTAVRHMVSAMCAMFIEDNMEIIKMKLFQNKKRNKYL